MNATLSHSPIMKSIKEFSRYALQANLMIVACFVVRLYFLTIRILSVNEVSIRRRLDSGNRLIAAIWRQRIIAVVGYAKRFGIYRPSVMISKSRDGDLVADFFRRLGFRPVRGSSSRDGKQALAALVADVQDHPFAVHVLDGPQGPRGVVKPGLVVLAGQSGAPVVPVYISMSRAWVLRSWDRCLIPKPFSRIVIRWDEMMTIPGNMDERAFEDARQRIETRMRENQRQDDRRFGWGDLV